MSIKKLALSLSVAGLVVGTPVPCFEAVATAASEYNSAISESSETPEISLRSSILEWRYKYENGKLYRRQFNTRTQTWVGKWILVK